ncbi:hypothetical protein [Macrococcus carouselicus]|uniref:Lipoprotein n=1 Tax=Macrococcus carouselicus TaxID=69969 RepID=A0A9Q8FMM2_9STAP|nr:hypothetical protein [Macrococcus carouselicus]TDM03695.1 hypothetical protein ERX40_00580 [Macrococcus carouselicus]
MKKYLYILVAAGVLAGCGQQSDTASTPTKEQTSSEQATTESPTTEQLSTEKPAEVEKKKTQEEDIHDHKDTAFKDTESKAPGVKKTYPLTKLTTETVDKTIKVKDNETVLYTEDTGHGIPTKPAGEGQEFHAILDVTFKDLKMYMLDNGTFITADPQHVEVIKTGDHYNQYPVYKMHADDVKYLDSLNKEDPEYDAYVKYAEDYGTRQYDYKREMLMHTAIHEVNDATPESLTIPEEHFLSLDQFKAKK